MGRKAHSNQTIETLAEEEIEEQPGTQEPPEVEESGSRPGSGILQETLEEIDKEETLIENEEDKSEEAQEEAAE